MYVLIMLSFKFVGQQHKGALPDLAHVTAKDFPVDHFNCAIHRSVGVVPQLDTIIQVLRRPMQLLEGSGHLVCWLCSMC